MAFKIGQKVIRVNKTTPSNTKKIGKVHLAKVAKNTIFIIKDICYCPKCGDQKIDIGLSLPVSYSGTESICATCDNVYLHYGKWFLASKDFRPVQYDNISDKIAKEISITVEQSDVKIKEYQISQ